MEQRVPHLRLSVDVTASINELFDYVRMPFNCSDVERFRPICLQRMIDVAARFNQQPCDGCMPILGRDEEWRCPICRLCKIDVLVSGDELRYDKDVPLGGCFV